MKENELKGMDEVLVHDVGETEAEFTNDGKSKKIKRIILLFIVLAVIAAIVVTLILLLKDKDDEKFTDHTHILKDNTDFIKPNNTTKKYQLIQLDKSKYKFILVQDPHTSIGGIEIKTNLGKITDLFDGFAHYAEHIFFGGTKDITELDLFSLISSYDEFVNAYTSFEETVFQYFGSSYTFEKLLNYISNFIQKPLLDTSFLESEKKVVNSEYDKANTSFRNIYQIYMENSNPDHGFFTNETNHIGSVETLSKVDVKVLADYLKNYYRTLFKPENCVFLLYSSESFEKMRKYAQKNFDFVLEEPSEEFNKLFSQKLEQREKPLFLEGQLGKVVMLNDLSDYSLLYFMFSIPQEEQYVDYGFMLFNILAQREDGGLFKFLTDRGYASYYTVYTLGNLKKYDLLAFYLYLTEEGCKNIDKIIEAIFAYINAIKNDNNLGDILDDLKTMDTKYYQNIEEKETYFPDDTDKILFNYHYYGENYMLGNPVELNYDKSKIQKVLEEIIPEKSFIFIDTQKEIKSNFIRNPETKYTKSFNAHYTINDIPTELIDNLKNIKTVDGYEFKLRSKIEDYTKLSGLTEKPCYEGEKNYECKYNEYDPGKDEEYEPYKVKSDDKVLSLMKIDRSYGSPFVNGYINFELDENLFKDMIKTNEQKALFTLMKESLNYMYIDTPLYIGWNGLTLFSGIEPTLTIVFSTFNDVLDKVIQYIYNFLTNPINEKDFNSLKEFYYLQNGEDSEDSEGDLKPDILKVFKRFISVDTYESGDFPLEIVKDLNYSDYLKVYENITEIITKLKYLTHGDISLNQSESTTETLASLIKESEINLLLSSPKKVKIPEKTSILFTTKSRNKYQRQGGTLVMYEYDSKLAQQMKLYSLCAGDFIFNYIRTKRGSGYTVHVYPTAILGKRYLLIYTLGKVYSPEKMDNLINEAIKESFSYKKCDINSIIKHLENRSKIDYYADNKFSDLIGYIESDVENVLTKETLNAEKMTFDSIIKDLKDTFQNKPKRIAILFHRGDITAEELENQKKELNENYYLNKDIKNIVTDNITFLEQYLEN